MMILSSFILSFPCVSKLWTVSAVAMCQSAPIYQVIIKLFFLLIWKLQNCLLAGQRRLCSIVLVETKQFKFVLNFAVNSEYFKGEAWCFIFKFLEFKRTFQHYLFKLEFTGLLWNVTYWLNGTSYIKNTCILREYVTNIYTFLY